MGALKVYTQLELGIGGGVARERIRMRERKRERGVADREKSVDIA